MMRVVWEEWRGGSVFSAKLLAWFALGTVLALLITQFQPGSVFLVLSIGALAGGFLSGGQHWNHPASEWLAEGVPVWQYALGKVGGTLFLNAAWAAFVAPPVLLLTFSWNMPLSAAASALAWVLAGSLAAQALSHAAARTTSPSGRLVAGLLMAAWLVGGLVVAGVQPLHPVWQIWRMFHDPDRSFDTVSWFALVGAAAILWTVAVVRLRWRAEP